MLPKLRLAGFGLSVPDVTPVPERGMLSVEFDASEVIVTVPLALPAAVGAKITVNVLLCEAVRVRGVEKPLS